MAVVQVQKRKGCGGIVVGAAKDWQGLLEVTKKKFNLHVALWCWLAEGPAKTIPSFTELLLSPWHLALYSPFTLFGSITYQVCERMSSGPKQGQLG